MDARPRLCGFCWKWSGCWQSPCSVAGAGLESWLNLFHLLVPVDLKALTETSSAVQTRIHPIIHSFILACFSRFLSPLALSCESYKISKFGFATVPCSPLLSLVIPLDAIGSTSTQRQAQYLCPNGPFTLPHLCLAFPYDRPNGVPEVEFPPCSFNKQSCNPI